MRRRSNGSIFISNLDPNLKERILNYPVSRAKLAKFENEEKKENAKYLIDLRDLVSKSEREVYNTLNFLHKNNQ